jgi:hypothetical protein
MTRNPDPVLPASPRGGDALRKWLVAAFGGFR